mmetsp:Transcript_40378/g.111249  ORF Transcript_40378/g.111249 Transcript_40378/m.111249 type:complete len:227 (+) Transcript_40378:2500-3180(+)
MLAQLLKVRAAQLPELAAELVIGLQKHPEMPLCLTRDRRASISSILSVELPQGVEHQSQRFPDDLTQRLEQSLRLYRAFGVDYPLAKPLGKQLNDFGDLPVFNQIRAVPWIRLHQPSQRGRRHVNVGRGLKKPPLEVSLLRPHVHSTFIAAVPPPSWRSGRQRHAKVRRDQQEAMPASQLLRSPKMPDEGRRERQEAMQGALHRERAQLQPRAPPRHTTTPLLAAT